jgi:hypothetical protein
MKERKAATMRMGLVVVSLALASSAVVAQQADTVTGRAENTRGVGPRRGLRRPPRFPSRAVKRKRSSSRSVILRRAAVNAWKFLRPASTSRRSSPTTL